MLSYSISLFLKETNIPIKYKTEEKHKKCQCKAHIHNVHKHKIRNHCSQAKDQDMKNAQSSQEHLSNNTITNVIQENFPQTKPSSQSNRFSPEIPSFHMTQVVSH